jgi:ATP synthase protein I
MTPKPDKPTDDISRQAKRKKAFRDDPGPSPLRGIGTFGMVGWSIAVPTIGGAFAGHRLDQIAPQDFSWTIALILGGVVVGAIIAASWVRKEGDEK